MSRSSPSGSSRKIHLSGNESGLARRKTGARRARRLWMQTKCQRRTFRPGREYSLQMTRLSEVAESYCGRSPNQSDGFATGIRHWRRLAINSCFWWLCSMRSGSKWDCRKVSRTDFPERAGSNAKLTISKKGKQFDERRGASDSALSPWWVC